MCFHDLGKGNELRRGGGYTALAVRLALALLFGFLAAGIGTVILFRAVWRNFSAADLTKSVGVADALLAVVLHIGAALGVIGGFDRLGGAVRTIALAC